MINSFSHKNDKKKPKISVIVPFHGDKEDLKKCLNGLINQHCNFFFEMIVIESGNDNEIKELFDSYPDILFISFDGLLFPGKARNCGVEKSTSNYLAFIDGDCVPEPNWITGLYSCLTNGYEVVIGPILNLYPVHPVASVDNLLLFPDFQKLRRSNKFKQFPPCNLGITKNLFLEAGEFPEDLKLGEDTIFSRSVLKKKDLKIIYNSKIVVRHSGRKNFKSFLKHQKSFGFNRQYNFSKERFMYKLFGKTFMFSVFTGFRRFIYIIGRTFQWNPLGMIRIIIYSPLIVIGLSAWVLGFWGKNKRSNESNF